MYHLGAQSALHLVVYLATLIATWWALQSFKFDLFFKNPKSAQAKLLMIFLTIAIGFNVARFFLSYFTWSMNLPYIWTAIAVWV